MTLIFSQIVWMWPLNLLMCPFELYMFIGVSMQLSSNVLIPYCWSVALEKKKKKKKKIALLYPAFMNHIDSLMKKKVEWAHCYRKDLMLRGNHTNNYAEAGINPSDLRYICEKCQKYPSFKHVLKRTGVD